jgi:hypothetical protein
MGVQGIANIAHAVDKMQLTSKSAQQITAFVARQDNKNAQGGHISAKGSQNPEVARNIRIVALGRDRDWEGILALYHEQSKHFNNVNLATSMSQLGRIRSVNTQDPTFLRFVDDLTNTIEARGLEWMGIQGIANIVHAIGKMQLKSNSSRRILEFVARQDNAHAIIVMKGDPQAVANICWAMAKLGRSDIFPSFMGILEDQVHWFVKEGNPQDVANIASACAKLGVPSPKLFAEIDNQSSWLVKAGNPQTVANTAWACATLGFPSPNLFLEIENQSSWIVKEGSPQAIANTAWACATVGFSSPKLLSAVESRSSWIVTEGNPQDVANIAWASAKMGFQSPKLFSEIEKQSAWIVKEAGKSGNMQGIATIAFSFATLGYASEEIFGSLRVGQLVPKLIEESNPQAVVNICFSFAILDLANNHETEFRLLWAKAISLDRNVLPLEGRRQLFQAHAFVTASGVESLEAPPLLETDDSVAGESNAQNEVSGLLDELGFQHEVEVSPLTKKNMLPLPRRMLAIDMACRKRMVAIEFDGPSHFLREVGSGKVLEIENGATKAKRRFLERLGWKVVNIRYFDWAKAKSKEAKRSFVSEILKEVD